MDEQSCPALIRGRSFATAVRKKFRRRIRNVPMSDTLRRWARLSAGTSHALPRFQMRSEESIMENTQTAQHCILNAPIRDRAGRIRFQEQPRVLRKINNLDRQMLLVQFDDGATTFVFPNEVTLC